MSRYDADSELARSRQHVKDVQRGGSGKDHLPPAQRPPSKFEGELEKELYDAIKPHWPGKGK